MRALIATDGSDDAVAAAERGLELLSGTDRITIVCAVSPPAILASGMESGFAGGTATREEIESAWAVARRDADEAIDRTLAALPRDRTYDRATPEGDAGSALCELAEDTGADAIVVGSRGRGAIKRALLGSVSSYVAQHAPCPVLIIRTGTA